MATLTVATAARTGVDLAGVAATSGGDAFLNTGREVLIVTNGDSGSHTATIHSQKTPDGLALTDRVITVAAGVTKAIGPFPVGLYNDTNNLAQITYSAVTSVTVKVLKVAAE